MAKPLRVEYEGAAYHITSRGNAREKLFLDDEDRTVLLATLGEKVLPSSAMHLPVDWNVSEKRVLSSTAAPPDGAIITQPRFQTHPSREERK